jgi:apolipoprotein N-acyltransferase
MRTEAIAYRPSWRVTAAILTVVSRGSLLVFVLLLLFPESWPGATLRLDNPLRLFRAFAGFSLTPGLAAWLLGRALRVTVLVEHDALVLERRGYRAEIPFDVIDRIVPWTVVPPVGGVWIRLTSGRRFRVGLQVVDPIALVEALTHAGAPERLRGASREPAAIYARSRRSGSHRWYHPVLKFIVFGLVPALPLFRLHQWVAYGGTFGEYYMYGLHAYLLAFAINWATCSVYLVLYAAVLRAAVEPLVLAAAYVAPSRTLGARRAAETVHRLLYYGGVALFLLRLLYLAS